MERILLIVPDRPYLLNQKALPNLGTLLTASIFKRHGCEVKVLDYSDRWQYEDSDLYGITCTTPDFPRVIEIMKWIRRENPDAKIVIGGSHPTLMPQECLDAGFNTVSVGDAEETVPRILNGAEGIIEGWTQNIDAYHADRKAVDLWQYEFHVGGVRATSMMTCRGCIWGKCAFCSRFDKGARFHSVDYVHEEIQKISDLGFRAVMIYDDEFFTHPERDREIIELLGLYGCVWRCFGRSDFILRNSELVDFAAENRLKEVLLGVESGDDGTLKAIDKGVTVEENKKAVKFLYDDGVKVKAAMIVGLPGESKETLKNTEKFCEEVAPYVDAWDFTILQVYPGSAIWNNPRKYDLEWTCSYQAYKGMHTEGWNPSPISTSKLSFEEITEWRDRLERRFKRR